MNIGTIIAHHYRITELIGTGGMAHVYRAVSIATGRNVAIKVLKDEFCEDPQFLRRFEQEAHAVLNLSHQNIVKAYDVGTFEGLPYIIMEYVEGHTLKSIISTNGAMPPKTAISITCQVLQALHEAHEKGLIHRDVKPQNVIVTRDGRAKLTDFGIARDTNSSTKTMMGDTVIGSVHYISPEQATSGDVTQASDLYSVGVMLYEMLTGTVPFTGDSSVAIALKHINDQPCEPIQVNPVSVTPALNTVILKALQKDPASRYATAREMRSALIRADHDPSGATLLMPEEEETEMLPDSGKTSGSKHKAIPSFLAYGGIVAACLCAFLGTFYGVRRFVSASRSVTVPTVLARTLDAAEKKASDYGFTLVVEDYVTDTTVPAGTVISQNPEVGSKAKPGTSLSVVISLGTEAECIPDLRGKTLEEARLLLEGCNMQLGDVNYQISDVSIGYICDQSPAAGSDLVPGGTVNICVSATTTGFVELPSLVPGSLEEALSLLSEYGLDGDVWIRFLEVRLGTPGIVESQSPEPGSIAPGATIELTVSCDGYQVYAYDYAMNLSVPEPETSILVTVSDSLDGIPYTRVVYEAKLEKGSNVPVSFTAYVHEPGTHELTVQIGSQQPKTIDIEIQQR